MDKELIKQQFIEGSNLSLPCKITSKEFFSLAKEQGLSRSFAALNILKVSTTTGRSMSLSDEYEIEIDAVSDIFINRIIPVNQI